MYIAIAGNIGSGKTTLTKLLASHYGWDAHFEKVDDNPYLNDFYDDMQRWAFNLQVFFLNKRLQDILEIQGKGTTAILDRTLYEDAYIFASNLKDMGLMSECDYKVYLDLFEQVCSVVRPPELLIYLRASVPVLVSQIQKRGRSYESGIRLNYLQRLNEHYEAWVSGYNLGKLLIIDVDKTKFSENPEDLNHIISQIDSSLKGIA